ncbi:MAG: MATE family efflux transporter [Candidatus Aminicenantales bacterium]
MTENKIDQFLAQPRRALLTLALPIFIATFVQTMYNVVDTAYVGRLGADSIAALTFCFPVFFFLIGLNSGIAIGMNSSVSRYLGAKDKEAAERSAAHGLVLSFAFGAIVIVLGLFFLKPLFSLFGADPAVLPLAIGYMRIILLGVLFMFPSFIMSSIFSAQGDTRTPMKVQVAGLVLNAILDPIFIYLLRLGVQGAAEASVLGFLFALVLFLFFLRRKSYLRISFHGFRFSFRLVWEICQVGVPASLMMLLLSIYVVFINRFMAHFGTKTVAAFGLVSRLESFATMPIVALSVSLVTLVGMFYGARRSNEVKDIAWHGIRAGVVLTAGVGVVFFVTAKLWLMIFTGDAALLGLGIAYLRVDVLTFPLMSTSMIISRIMQGLGMGAPGFFINFIRIMLVAVPLAYFFVFVIGWGFLSVAWAMVLGGLASNVTALLWLKFKFDRLKAESRP